MINLTDEEIKNLEKRIDEIANCCEELKKSLKAVQVQVAAVSSQLSGKKSERDKGLKHHKR